MRGGYYDAGSASRQCDVGNARLTVGGGQWEAGSERRAIARRVMRGGLIRRGQCKAGSARSAMQGRQCKADCGRPQWEASGEKLAVRG